MGVSISKFLLRGRVAAWGQIKLCPTLIVAVWQCGSVAVTPNITPNLGVAASIIIIFTAHYI